jgi:hypothetical protein
MTFSISSKTLVKLVLALFLCLAASLATTAAAGASTTPNANAADNAKISSTYVQYYFAGSSYHAVTYACTGEHIDNSAQVKENETCAITGDTSGLIAGDFASNPGSPYGILGAFGYSSWFSDYNGVFATAWQATFKQAGNGWTLRIYSQYPVSG